MAILHDDERRFREVAARHSKSGKQLDAAEIAREANVTPQFAKGYLRRMQLTPGRPLVFRKAPLHAVPADEPSGIPCVPENADADELDDTEEQHGDLQRHDGPDVDAVD